MVGRSYRTERLPSITHPSAFELCKERCKATLRLDGVEYRCARHDHVDGIHDAFATHPADVGLVRW